jgi:Protein of unknown function (DUF429)
VDIEPPASGATGNSALVVVAGEDFAATLALDQGDALADPLHVAVVGDDQLHIGVAQHSQGSLGADPDRVGDGVVVTVDLATAIATGQRRGGDVHMGKVPRRRCPAGAADRLGSVGMRCALLQRRWGEEVWGGLQPRDGSGMVVETYPTAAFKAWGIDCRGYKDRADAARAHRSRESVVELIERSTGASFDLDSVRSRCISSDHVLDACQTGTAPRTGGGRCRPSRAVLPRRGGGRGCIGVRGRR